MIETPQERSLVLLQASLDILRNIYNSEYADAIGITAIWDEADCDGYCLMGELEWLLEDLKEESS